ncbi:MAG: class I SAM-dependent methyltransferase, partial [Verrucomicrobia bacterium]|nr:class I SAM-dependent methyltransferase [Verrucomicrobiota bacterium]
MRRVLQRWLKQALPRGWVERLQDLRWAGLPVPFRVVRPHTMLSNLNLFFLLELAERLDRWRVEGDYVECGVYRGGSAGVLGYQLRRSPLPRSLWLYDTFTGTPAASAHDDEFLHAMAGRMVGSEAQTRRILERLGVVEGRVRIVRGLIEETLGEAAPARVALLHVDCNLFRPVLASLEVLYPRMAPGGLVVLNDY